MSPISARFRCLRQYSRLLLAVHEEPAPNRFCLRKFDLTSFVLILRMLAAPVPFRSSPALLIQLKFDPTLLLFFGIIRACDPAYARCLG